MVREEREEKKEIGKGEKGGWRGWRDGRRWRGIGSGRYVSSIFFHLSLFFLSSSSLSLLLPLLYFLNE